METLVSDITQALESGAQRSAVRFADSELVLERTSDGGLTVSTPGQSSSGRFFRGAPKRPAGYPADLPFVPDEPVMVSLVREGTSSLNWIAPRDPRAVFEQLDRQCVEEAWELKHRREIEETAVHLGYQKGAVSRTLLLSSPGAVTVIQTRSD